MISQTEQQMHTVYTNLVFTQTLRSLAYNHCTLYTINHGILYFFIKLV